MRGESERPVGDRKDMMAYSTYMHILGTCHSRSSSSSSSSVLDLVIFYIYIQVSREDVAASKLVSLV